ncbi:lipopolysaccharide biosynthesis protein RfbH, partial [Brachyspira catarrhinii]
LFAGNIIKQPYMIGRNYRVIGNLINSDFIMNNTFWIGVYPGIDDSMIDYVELIIGEFISNLGGK